MAQRIEGGTNYLSPAEVRAMLEPRNASNTSPKDARKILGGNNEGMLRDPKSNNLDRIRAQRLAEEQRLASQEEQPVGLIDTIKGLFRGDSH